MSAAIGYGVAERAEKIRKRLAGHIDRMTERERYRLRVFISRKAVTGPNMGRGIQRIGKKVRRRQIGHNYIWKLLQSLRNWPKAWRRNGKTSHSPQRNGN